MFKKILAPIQSFILIQGKCVGCGRNLAQGKKISFQNNCEKVICACKRIFIFEKRKGKFRRATIEEGYA